MAHRCALWFRRRDPTVRAARARRRRKRLYPACHRHHHHHRISAWNTRQHRRRRPRQSRRHWHRIRSVHLIDGSGVAYTIPGANDDIVAQLGYETTNIATLPQPWLQFFTFGPALTVEAARSTPNAASTPGT
ncbi:type VII secretion protein EccB [Salinibacterium sp. PAMC 21357]|uniref:type VII secretion protein EccB n=1 Tax=Salinibacterium sp. PAMC 21357 TaxID=1112215 RepID=UPI003FD6BD49